MQARVRGGASGNRMEAGPVAGERVPAVDELDTVRLLEPVNEAGKGTAVQRAEEAAAGMKAP